MLKIKLFVAASFLWFVSGAQTLNIYVNDTVYRPEPIIYTQTDSIQGVVSADFANYPGKLAFSANYYNSFRTGFVKYYYPSGKLMMTQVFQRSMKNGEYTLYDEAGEVLVKGEYMNNEKNGFWAYRKYKFMGTYKNGVKHGNWKYILPDGSKLTYKYKKGVLEKGKTELPLPKIPNYILKDGVIVP